MFEIAVKQMEKMSILPWAWKNLYKNTEGEINKDVTKSRFLIITLTALIFHLVQIVTV